MDPLRQFLRQHLQAASAAYGGDLPLPGGHAQAIAKAVAAAPASPDAAAPAAVADTAAAEPAATPTTRPPAFRRSQDTAERLTALAALQQEVATCERCKLCSTRKHTVFGEGNPAVRVMFVGEAPGAVEDQTGRPFVGPAGQLLERIIENAMGLRRSDVFIGNINKCRPPGNRDPEPDEVAACLPYLKRQVELIQPEAIVALGRVAAHNLLGTDTAMRLLRGRDLAYEGIPVVVTWHPAYLLRDPSHKRETWDDIKRLNRVLGLPEVPPTAAGQA